MLKDRFHRNRQNRRRSRRSRRRSHCQIPAFVQSAQQVQTFAALVLPSVGYSSVVAGCFPVAAGCFPVAAGYSLVAATDFV
jgi:hypothetical protein